MSQPLRMHRLQGFDHARYARQNQAVRGNRRNDAVALQGLDQPEDADPKAEFALRPAAVVGVEAAVFAHEARIPQAARGRIEVPVLEVEHNVDAQHGGARDDVFRHGMLKKAIGCDDLHFAGARIGGARNTGDAAIMIDVAM